MDIESADGYVQAMRFQDDQAAGDRALAVRFYHDEFEDPEASKAAGRPIFKTEECVEIQAPGSRDVRMGRVKYMKPDPRQRFAAAYAEWKRKNGAGVHIVGTPLKQWGLVTPAVAKSYAAVGIHSVEQLAALSDTNAREIMGSLTDRQKARDFLAQTKGLEPVAEARAELEKARNEIETLKDIVRQQGDKIEALVAAQNGIAAPPPKRRGRPPKVQPGTEN